MRLVLDTNIIVAGLRSPAGASAALLDRGLSQAFTPMLTDISKADGTSINQFVTTAIAEKIAAMKTAEFFTTHGTEADIEAARRLLRRAGGQPPPPEDHRP